MRHSTSTLILLSLLICLSPMRPMSAIPTSTADVAQPKLPMLAPSYKKPEMPLEFFNFLKDCFILNLNDGQKQYAAWLPLPAFVRMYATAGGDTKTIEPKVDALKPYLMFMVENKITDQFKNPTHENADSLRSRAVLRFPDGTEVKPLEKPPEGIPNRPPAFGDLANKHGELLVFPAGEHTELDSEQCARGKLTLVLNANDTFKESRFTWHLPLELAGVTKECGHCHNDISAKWQFCPWCGSKQRN